MVWLWGRQWAMGWTVTGKPSFPGPGPQQPCSQVRESEVTQLCPTFATPWTVDYEAPPSMQFSRQEYWSGLPFPSAGDLPDPGIKPGSPTLQTDALPSEPPGKQPCPQQPCSQVRETTLKQRGPQADITVNDVQLDKIRLGHEQRESERGCLRLKLQGCPLEEAELKAESTNDHKLAMGRMGKDSRGQKRTWWAWNLMAPTDQSEWRTAWDEAAEAVKC